MSPPRQLGFAGRSVIITGASTGIGVELARQLASQGARVALGARSQEALEDAARQCRAAGGEAIAVGTDVTDPEACGRLVAATVDAFGGVDALVNNAGVSMRARFDDTTDLSVFEWLMRVNYLGAVYMTHHALPHLRERRGLAVAISSLTGKTGVPTRTGYGASKWALQGFFDALRVELRHTGVDVLVVSPGFVDTGIRERALGGHGEVLGPDPSYSPTSAQMPVGQCARLIVRAMERRKRELVMTRKARLGQWLKLIAPGLIDRVAARAVGDHGGRIE